MVVEKGFLSLEEVTNKTYEFKKRWYSLVGKAEGLTKYKSGFDEGFKKTVKAIYADVEACKEHVDELEHQLKHYFPDNRSDITWMTKKIFRVLEDLRVMAKKDFEVLESSKDLADSLKSLTGELEEAEAKLKEAEEKSGEACRKYFDMKNEYTAESQSIEEGVKKEMDKIREKFIEMTTPIVEGHDITFGGRAVSISELFELLAEHPEDTEKINLVVRKGGLFGKKAETDLAKTSVLKYVSGEILEAVPPIQQDRKKKMDRLKAKYSELPKLEKACEDAEKKRKKLAKPVEELREKISSIKKSEVFKFGDYDGILETREQYLEKIGEAEKEVKEYLDFALLNLKDYVELEPDVEKRKLLSEVREAREKVKSLEKEAAKAREELSNVKKELTSMTAAKEELEKKLKSAVDQRKAAEEEMKKMRERTLELQKRAREFESAVQADLTKLQSDFQSKLAELSRLMETPGRKGEEKKVEEKLDKLRGKK